MEDIGFHWQNGIYFKRLDDGAVEIVQESEKPANYLRIDADSWASIVASVSKQGEEQGRFYQAKEFHGSEKDMRGLIEAIIHDAVKQVELGIDPVLIPECYTNKIMLILGGHV